MTCSPWIIWYSNLKPNPCFYLVHRPALEYFWKTSTRTISVTFGGIIRFCLFIKGSESLFNPSFVKLIGWWPNKKRFWPRDLQAKTDKKVIRRSCLSKFIPIILMRLSKMNYLLWTMYSQHHGYNSQMNMDISQRSKQFFSLIYPKNCPIEAVHKYYQSSIISETSFFGCKWLFVTIHL